MTAAIDYSALRDAAFTEPQYATNRDFARKEILKNLDRVGAYGATPWQIFDDWLDLVLDSLEATRGRFYAYLNQSEYQQPEESAKLFQRLRHRYGNRQEPFDYFAKAMAALWDTTTTGYWDTIGDCYMEWGTYNKWNGQFFTPFNVATMMASMLGSPAGQVQDHLTDAIMKSVPAQARLMAGLAYSIVPKNEAIYRAYFITRVLPHVLEHYEPVKVHDPACGSGVMFLAYAQITPPWMLNMGLVQFYGQDIDETCVKMARINSLLYGLNGVWAPMFFMEQAQLLADYENGTLDTAVLDADLDKPLPVWEAEKATVAADEQAETAAAPAPDTNGKAKETAVDPRLQTYLQGLDQQHVQLNLFNTIGGKEHD